MKIGSDAISGKKRVLRLLGRKNRIRLQGAKELAVIAAKKNPVVSTVATGVETTRALDKLVSGRKRKIRVGNKIVSLD